MRNCPLFNIDRQFAFGRLLTSDNFFADNSSQIFKEEKTRKRLFIPTKTKMTETKTNRNWNMEIKKNLLRNEKKSYLRFIIGICFFVMSIIWIALRIKQEQEISLFDWFYFGIFTLNGISHSIGSFGFRIEQLFGKAFILINKEKISMKLKVLEKEQTVFWSEIEEINYHLNKIQIHKTDNTILTFNLSELDYAFKNEIKEFLKRIATEKQIITAL